MVRSICKRGNGRMERRNIVLSSWSDATDDVYGNNLIKETTQGSCTTWLDCCEEEGHYSS